MIWDGWSCGGNSDWCNHTIISMLPAHYFSNAAAAAAAAEWHLLLSCVLSWCCSSADIMADRLKSLQVSYTRSHSTHSHIHTIFISISLHFVRVSAAVDCPDELPTWHAAVAAFTLGWRISKTIVLRKKVTIVKQPIDRSYMMCNKLGLIWLRHYQIFPRPKCTAKCHKQEVDCSYLMKYISHLSFVMTVVKFGSPNITK